MTVFARACAATSVAFGAIYMLAAGAPHRYILVNAIALVVGVLASTAIMRVPLRNRRLASAATVAIGLLLAATAVYGVHIDGASRWIDAAGIALQPSLILLPPAMMLFARERGWLSSIGLAIASIGLALQPDRAMAGTLAAGLAALSVYRREPPVIVALACATVASAATMLRPDVVAPVAFVEQVVQSAFAFHVVAGFAIVAGLAALLAPAVAGLAAPSKMPEAFAVSGAIWLAVIVFAIAGNYPTPLVGYGSSAILGYCLSAAALAPPSRER